MKLPLIILLCFLFSSCSPKSYVLPHELLQLETRKTGQDCVIASLEMRDLYITHCRLNKLNHKSFIMKVTLSNPRNMVAHAVCVFELENQAWLYDPNIGSGRLPLPYYHHNPQKYFKFVRYNGYIPVCGEILVK